MASSRFFKNFWGLLQKLTTLRHPPATRAKPLHPQGFRAEQEDSDQLTLLPLLAALLSSASRGVPEMRTNSFKWTRHDLNYQSLGPKGLTGAKQI